MFCLYSRNHTRFYTLTEENADKPAMNCSRIKNAKLLYGSQHKQQHHAGYHNDDFHTNSARDFYSIFYGHLFCFWYVRESGVTATAKPEKAKNTKNFHINIFSKDYYFFLSISIAPSVTLV